MMRKGERGGRGGVGRVSRLRYLHGRWKGPSSPTILSGRDDENTATPSSPPRATRRDETRRVESMQNDTKISSRNERTNDAHACTHLRSVRPLAEQYDAGSHSHHGWMRFLFILGDNNNRVY